jgi:hypothetical protein
MVEIGVLLDTSLSLLGYQIGVHFFQPTSANKVATIEDKNMRFELVGERSVRLWLGDKNEKVMIGNVGFIITDK